MRHWQEIADALGVLWCEGCDPLLDSDFGHTHGRAVPDRDGVVTVHWYPRRYTRHGAGKFLRAIARAQLGLATVGTWGDLYDLNQQMLRLARLVHVSLPRTIFEADRARLRYLLGEITIQERRTWEWVQQTKYRKALRWAARS